MTAEEKRILLIDLCPRLPYGLKLRYVEDLVVKKESHIITLNTVYLEHILNGDADIKPYLRPMESMTEEEKMELKEEQSKDTRLFAEALTRAAGGDNSMHGKVIPHFAADWCYKNHFDFRGLIKMELALEEPEGMYKK